MLITLRPNEVIFEFFEGASFYKSWVSCTEKSFQNLITFQICQIEMQNVKFIKSSMTVRIEKNSFSNFHTYSDFYMVIKFRTIDIYDQLSFCKMTKENFLAASLIA